MIQRVELPHRTSMHREIASAYLASGSRIVAWVAISAIVYRMLGAEAFALLALIRATIGLLNYCTLGLAPAMIRLSAAARAAPGPVLQAGRPGVLDYESRPLENPLGPIWSSGQVFAMLAIVLGSAVIAGYAVWFLPILNVPAQLRRDAPFVAATIGAGTLVRLAGDAPGAILQTSGKIALDNLLVAAADLLWIPLSLLYLRERDLVSVAVAYLNSGMLVVVFRWYFAGRAAGQFFPHPRQVRGEVLRQLASFGIFVVVAQLADYLYAPVDYFLINRLISDSAVAVYAPAVQIDAGLLLLVSGLSAVLLPRSALAHGAGQVGTVRQYYIRGTLASLVILAVASAAVLALSPFLFRLWLGDPMGATQTILPLVLIHTTLGGSSAVGRSILLGIGKVRAFTIAVLAAGIANVLLSWFFVAHLHLGLPGIIYGTLAAVVGRCVVWMPWYTLRALRHTGQGA